jgi:hypothetical protein
MVLEFLNDLYKKKISYGALNTARSSISSVNYCDGFSVGQHPLVIRFMKGVFKLRPNLPKYNRIWDPKIVLKLLGNWSPNSELELKKLTFKLVTLAALITGQRLQTIHLFKLSGM